jgi:PhnB protein
MTRLNVYLNFAGNTEEAFNFYRSVFGGKIEALNRFSDMPRGGGKVSANEKNKILSVTLPIDGSTLMASDTLGSRGQRLIQGNNFYISITPDSKKEADRIFDKLSEDGRVILPISDQPWNAYYGSFTDKFGIRWMVNYTYPRGKEKAGAPAARAEVKAKAKSKVKPKVKPVEAKAKPAVAKDKVKKGLAKAKPVQKQKPKVKPAPLKKKTQITAVKKKAKLLPSPKKKAAPVTVTKSKAKQKSSISRPTSSKTPRRELVGAAKGR